MRYDTTCPSTPRCHRNVLSIQVVLLREQVTHATDHNRKLPGYPERVCVLAITRFFRLFDTEVSQIDSLERSRVKVLV